MQQSELAGFAVSQHWRLFFALMPDAGTRQRMSDAVQQLIDASKPSGRRSDAARYHLTLQFLGDFDALPPSLIDAATAAAVATQAQVPAFDVLLNRAGSFGADGSRLWWLGCDAPPAALTMLWHELGRNLARQRVRLPTGASFVPHVTVLRGANRAPPPLDAPLVWPVDRFALVCNTPGARQGYDVLGEWPLLRV